MDINIKHFIPKEEHRGALETLLFQLSGKKRSVNLETHPDSYLIGAFESEKLIGFTQIFVLHKCAFTFGLLEDVIVDEIYRNKESERG